MIKGYTISKERWARMTDFDVNGLSPNDLSKSYDIHLAQSLPLSGQWGEVSAYVAPQTIRSRAPREAT